MSSNVRWFAGRPSTTDPSTSKLAEAKNSAEPSESHLGAGNRLFM